MRAVLEHAAGSMAAVHGAARALDLPAASLDPLFPALAAGATPTHLLVDSDFHLGVQVGLTPRIARALGLDGWQDFDALTWRRGGWSLVAGSRGLARVRLMLFAQGLAPAGVDEAEGWLRFLGGNADLVAAPEPSIVGATLPTRGAPEMVDSLAKAQALGEELGLGERMRLALRRVFPVLALDRPTLVGASPDRRHLELRFGGAAWDELLSLWPLFGADPDCRAPRLLGAVAGAANVQRVDTIVVRFSAERVTGEVLLGLDA
jgi:hypothetical protein